MFKPNLGVHVVPLMAVCSILIQPLPLTASDWVVGDVFVAVGNGCYQVYSNRGVLKETICDTLLPRVCDNDGRCDLTAGCAFDPSLSRLFTTNFFKTKLVVYDIVYPHSIVQIIDT